MNFFARSIKTDKVPSCPHCKRPKLEKQISLFAATSGSAESEDGMDDFPVDESKMERAIEALAGEAEKMSDDDPRAAAQLMRKFSDMTGMGFNDGIEQALHRMESGEDPEAIEAEMGDALDAEDPFVINNAKTHNAVKKDKAQRGAPRYDKKLYDL
jgi:hypothetical protein